MRGKRLLRWFRCLFHGKWHIVTAYHEDLIYYHCVKCMREWEHNPVAHLMDGQ
jgi:hypothetical protein